MSNVQSFYASSKRDQNDSAVQREVAVQGGDVDRGEVSAEGEDADQGVISDQGECIDQGEVDVKSENHVPDDDVPTTEDCNRGDDDASAGSAADDMLGKNTDSVSEEVSEDPVCIFCNKSRKEHQDQEQKLLKSIHEAVTRKKKVELELMRMRIEQLQMNRLLRKMIRKRNEMIEQIHQYDTDLQMLLHDIDENRVEASEFQGIFWKIWLWQSFYNLLYCNFFRIYNFYKNLF